jgi:hypothetical protein
VARNPESRLIHRLSDRDNFTLIMISSPIRENPLFADVSARFIQNNQHYHGYLCRYIETGIYNAFPLKYPL